MASTTTTITRRILLFTLAALIASAPVAATARGKSAEALLKEAGDLLKQDNHRAALKVLGKARRKAKQPPTRARVHLLRGLAYGELGKKRRAKKEFERALRIAPLLEPGEGEAKDKGLALFQHVREQRKGTLQVEVDKKGALVFINGKEVGVTPFKGKVPEGRYRVVVNTPDDMYRHEAEIRVVRQDTTIVVAQLGFAGSWLRVFSRPPGATVTVDGKKVGVTPLKDFEIRSGGHKVVVALDGHLPETRLVKAPREDRVTLSVELDPAPSKP